VGLGAEVAEGLHRRTVWACSGCGGEGGCCKVGLAAEIAEALQRYRQGKRGGGVSGNKTTEGDMPKFHTIRTHMDMTGQGATRARH